MNITKKWFDGKPKNAEKSSVKCTTNDGLTFITKSVGDLYNEWKINLIDPGESDEVLDIVIGNKKIDISLATEEEDGDIMTTFEDLEKALEDYFITVECEDGKEKEVLKEEKNLELKGGAYGTVCQDIYVTVEYDSDYYVNILPNSIHDANWRKVTLATY